MRPSRCRRPVAPNVEQRLYKWTDNNGVVHYGDKIPPEYADRDRDVLNDQGVRVGFEEGEVTEAEERAVLEQREARAEDEPASTEPRSRAAIACCSRPTRPWPTSRICAIGASSCSSRRSRSPSSTSTTCASASSGCKDEASDFKPYTTRADAPQIPENLALDISRTTASISLYEQTLARTRADQRALRDSFDNDIDRFRELKGG